MAITIADLNHATFGCCLEDVEELTLSNKALVSIEGIHRTPNLVALNVSFNSLQSISGVEVLSRLQALNLMHNKLVHLKPLALLPQLTQLNVSSNKISSLAGLSCCTALQQLLLHQNSICLPQDLAGLSGLRSLQRLSLKPNPVCEKLQWFGYRPSLVALCSCLQVVDGNAVTADEQQTAALISLESLSAPRRPTFDARPQQGLLDFAGVQSRMGQAAPGRARRPHSSQAALSNDIFGASLGRSQSSPPCVSDTGGGHAVSAPGSAPTSQFRPASSCTMGTPAKHGRRSGRAPAFRASDPNADIQSVLDALPTFAPPASQRRNASKLRPPRGAPVKVHVGNSSKDGTALDLGAAAAAAAAAAGAGARALAAAAAVVAAAEDRAKAVNGPPAQLGLSASPAAAPSGKQHELVHEVRYPQGSQTRAVSVWGDGSATAQWPNGDLAVTVTIEDAPQQRPPKACIFAAHRATGNVAVSFDGSGGFAQYANGSMMMNYNRATGVGVCYSSKGEVTRRWRDADLQSWPAGEPQASVELRLDPFLGLQYIIPTGMLYVYFSCEGAKHRLVCACNPAGATWPIGVVGAGAAAGDGGLDVVQVPSFLRELDTQCAGMGRGASGAAKVDARPVEERMDDVASITAALRGLDSDLQDWVRQRAAATAAAV